MSSILSKQAILGGLVDNMLDKKDAALSNVGVKERLDAIGALMDDLKAKWNTVNPGDLITATSYGSKTFVET